MKLLTALLCSVFAASCASAVSGGEEEYVFVFLVTGPAQLTAEEASEVFRGHFSNMGTMVEDGRLMLAGPFGNPRPDPSLRGVLVFDTPSMARAAEWASSDPGVQAGVFEFEAYPFRCDLPLGEIARLDAEELARRQAQDPTAEWAGRGYVLAIADDGEAAFSVMGSEVAPFRGLLGGDMQGKALFILDVEDTEEASELIGDTAGWDLHPWYGTTVLPALLGIEVR